MEPVRERSVAEVTMGAAEAKEVMVPEGGVKRMSPAPVTVTRGTPVESFITT
jgi:hypothetical protein